VIDRISLDCDVLVHPVDESMAPAQLAMAIRGVDGVMVAGARINKEIVDAASRLRLLATITSMWKLAPADTFLSRILLVY
jgi:hypothetical protein